MDAFVNIVFWASFFLLGYCYLGYGLLAIIFSFFKGPRKPLPELPDTQLPSVTLVITAFQESALLQNKLNNILQLDYPVHLLNVLVVVDEPDPESLEILESFSSFSKILQPKRKGKYAAICRAMEEVNTALVVFSDANCELNKRSLKEMVRHYADPGVGAVAGEKKIIYKGSSSALGQAEGWYWEYESQMKKLDAGLYTVVGAAGELFSIRTRLFQPLPEPVILDDLVISLQVCLQGYRIAYEPKAFAMEQPSASLKEEEKRKVRIAAGAFQSLHLLKELLHPFRYPVLYFQFLSRRLFRWIVSPVFLLVLLITNSWLVISKPEQGFYCYFLLLQASCYLLALAGFWLINAGKKAGLAGIPFYFLFMNYCILRGLFRFLAGKQPVNWEKAQRQTT